MIASLLPALFPDIRVLLLARFLQGLTIGGTALVARAIFSDVYTPRKISPHGCFDWNCVGTRAGHWSRHWRLFTILLWLASGFLVFLNFVFPITHLYFYYGSQKLISTDILSV